MRKPVARVQTITTGQTFSADVVLMDQIRRKVKVEDTSWDPQYIILFCPITSRVGSDVEAALEKVPYGPRVILVLMHHTRDTDYSTAGRKWSETTENIDLDVHVLYHESVQGLLTCSQNNEAVLQIQDFLAGSKKASVWNLALDLLWYFCLTLRCITFYWVLQSDRPWIRLWNWSWQVDRSWMRLWDWFSKRFSHFLAFFREKPKVIKDRFP